MTDRWRYFIMQALIGVDLQTWIKDKVECDHILWLAALPDEALEEYYEGLQRRIKNDEDEKEYVKEYGGTK